MKPIKTIGVCGAGVMGSQLAALFAGAGYDVYLFDLERELAERGMKGALMARPPAFYLKRFAERVHCCDYEGDLEKLARCDWIIEAIAERLDWKKELYDKLIPHLQADAVLSSNTSGISLAELTEDLDLTVKRRFLITHFFNPPRYMRLVEMVTLAETDQDIARAMASFVGESLGKGVVKAHDSPNFIANRIGIHGMMLAIDLTRRMHFSVSQVDLLTGAVMGRPKSATYRTADLVGLDTLAAVTRTAWEKCPDDESRALFELPEIVARLVEEGHLGQKSGAGFYKKEGRKILELDFESFEYRPKKKVLMDAIGVAKRYTDPVKKLDALVYSPDPSGRFAWELIIGSLSYAACRVGEIADDIVAIDQAMKWGFGYQMGPFEAWDAIGVEKSVERMESEGKSVPPFVRRLLDEGHATFYEREASGHQLFFDFDSGAMQRVDVPESVVVLAEQKARGKEMLCNWSASLVDLGDGVGCVEFHSALQPEFNPIDGAIVDMVDQAFQRVAEEGMKGLVISHDGAHFSAGANLVMILEAAKSGKFSVIEEASRRFQRITQAIRYAPFPIVAAPFNLCLGGGYELVAPAARVVACAELYCGSVEAGVGLVPGAGGTLRLLTHLGERFPAARYGPMTAAQKAFEIVGFAKVSGSAYEAVEWGYLREATCIVLSRDHLIARGKQKVLDLAADYEPPMPGELVLPGEGGRLAMLAAIANFQKAGTISAHDALIGEHLARVLTGGDRADGIRALDEDYLLDLEREAFVSLAGEPKSQERMEHMLKKGKPLRN